VIGVRAKCAEDQAWVEELLVERWGATTVISNGAAFDAAALPALVAGERDGVATYVVEADGVAELVSLDARTPRSGVGTALIGALAALLRARGAAVLRLTTSNDNLDALRFYQRRGFRLTAVHRGGIDRARALKPSIPLIGQYGIPLHDELELRLDL
jgi:ribosomal protein S18 acetylase RimI-like enzyme